MNDSTRKKVAEFVGLQNDCCVAVERINAEMTGTINEIENVNHELHSLHRCRCGRVCCHWRDVMCIADTCSEVQRTLRAD